ncbi:hypothetical protein LSH36_198g02040 [Paralvinella palmiformis]|uniref:Uncharacterized protein n=1 Tax=Paralvinella palmiformis TaxID=53620 RepID=A0AAD9JR65_9ANNE|nr:hypothetical protein LSH36_198g02040 [Paralvinella palmiformis]
MTRRRRGAHALVDVTHKLRPRKCTAMMGVIGVYCVLCVTVASILAPSRSGTDMFWTPSHKEQYRPAILVAKYCKSS